MHSNNSHLGNTPCFAAVSPCTGNHRICYVHLALSECFNPHNVLHRLPWMQDVVDTITDSLSQASWLHDFHRKEREVYAVRAHDRSLCTQKQPKKDDFDMSFLTVHVCLQRIWSLGPKRTGPNFLLSSNSTSASLFAGVDSAVVRLSAKQEKKSASHPAQADLGGPGGPQVDDPALRPSELAEADTHSELSARVWSTSCSECFCMVAVQ